MALTRVWVQTASDGLIRADQIVGIDAHQTSDTLGKSAHWLIDVMLMTSVGTGDRGRVDIYPLHRTLLQTGHEPRNAPAALAGLLHQLDSSDAAGVVSAHITRPSGSNDHASRIEFTFAPFGLPSSTPADLPASTR